MSASGPISYFAPNDQKCGWRGGDAVSVSLVEYCALKSNPPMFGDSYCVAFWARSWKRAALLVPKPKRRSTALVDVKLPLDTPRKEMSSPYSLKGVSKRPSLTVPHAACCSPTHESRCAKAVLLLSRRNCVSSWKIARRPPPSFS